MQALFLVGPYYTSNK